MGGGWQDWPVAEETQQEEEKPTAGKPEAPASREEFSLGACSISVVSAFFQAVVPGYPCL